MSGQKLINSKSQSIHIFPVSTLKSDDVTSKSEGAQTCDICGILDIYQVVFQDVSRLKSDRLRMIKTYQDRSRPIKTICQSPSASILMPKDANSALRSFSAFTPSALGTCHRRELENHHCHHWKRLECRY
jgi:hypothetical protein